VEQIRRRLIAGGRMRDATLVSVLAYAGLRPGEALALRWGDVRNRTILVERALALGELKETKTGQRRTVRLLRPLAKDLVEWRLASGSPRDDSAVFPTRAGGLWTDWHWRNWRKRVFAVAVADAGVADLRPYDLRHSFVSLLIAEGRNVVEIAREAGHAPTMALATYGHVIEELEGAERRPAEEQIRAAREAGVPLVFPRAPERESAKKGNAWKTAEAL
jgi:integrase